MVAEVVHGAPCRFADPARFSLAHGGKDRHPFPVPIKVYDETIGVLKSAVGSAKLGNDEELDAIRRLDEPGAPARAHATGPSLGAFIAEERRRSLDYGGRSVFGWEPPAAARREEIVVSLEFLITALIVVVSPGTGVLFTLATGLSRGGRASVVAAFGCTLGIVPHMAAAILASPRCCTPAPSPSRRSNMPASPICSRWPG